MHLLNVEISPGNDLTGYNKPTIETINIAINLHIIAIAIV